MGQWSVQLIFESIHPSTHEIWEELSKDLINRGSTKFGWEIPSILITDSMIHSYPQWKGEPSIAGGYLGLIQSRIDGGEIHYVAE